MVLLHEFLGDCATEVWKKDGRDGLKAVVKVWGNPGYSTRLKNLKILKCRGSDTPRTAGHVQTTDFEHGDLDDD